MSDFLLLGISRFLLPVPGFLWHKMFASRQQDHSLAFMTPEHHAVRNFVVRELPRAGRPLTMQAIADGVGLRVERVTALVEDLEHHLTFLYRSMPGGVTWAYPVTVDQTPHRLEFASGEKLYAA